jgi:hypothetical protein
MSKMKSKDILSAFIGGCVVAAYAIYACTGPTTDGFAFGTVATVLGLLAGIKLREATLSQEP